VLNRARAIENGAYIISPCAYGKVAGGGESYGHSLIVNPWGTVLADAETGKGVIFADIDLGASEAARDKIPNLKGERHYRNPDMAFPKLKAVAE